ncbi:hypothetical protein ACLOJK_013993 [Asimina triloba]
MIDVAIPAGDRTEEERQRRVMVGVPIPPRRGLVKKKIFEDLAQALRSLLEHDAPPVQPEYSSPPRHHHRPPSADH